MDLSRSGRVCLCLGVEFGSVALPQHPQVDELGRVRLEAGLEQGSQVVIDGLTPQLIEPLLYLPDSVWCVVAQVQLQVGGQAGPGEVG